MAVNKPTKRKDKKLAQDFKLPCGVEFSNVTDKWNDTYDEAEKYQNGEVADNLYNYASSIYVAMGCLRRAFLDAKMGLKNPPKEGRERAMWSDTGNAMHEAIVKKYSQGGRCAGEEVRGTYGDVRLSYRIDMLFREDDGSVVPLEIKTANQNSYEGMISTFGPTEGEWFVMPAKIVPKMDHVCQLMSYMHFHRETPDQRTPYQHGYLHYMSKNDDVSTLFRIEYDKELGDAIEERLKLLNAHVDMDELPQPYTTKWYEGTDVCKFCPYGGDSKFMSKRMCEEGRTVMPKKKERIELVI